jgi:5'-3' exonuclease
MIQPIRRRVAEVNGIDTKKYQFTCLIDGNNLLKIASVNKEMNNEGKQYGMIVTALRLIGEILKRKDFNYCVIVFDGEGSGVLRWEYYKDYKANRDKNYEQHDPKLNDYLKKYRDFQKMVISKSRENASTETDDESFKRQKEILQYILQELCIRQYEFENVEGDDIISYYVKNKRDNEKIVIVSSDKDLTQLISNTVIVYNPRIKDFITKENAVEKIGIIPENIVLEKVICGDVSDNIKGVKGVGNKTLIDLFPQIKSEKIDLSFIMRRSKELLDERKQEKKKPLKSLENILNGVTDGCQGDKLYEINQKIIDLSEPLLTDEAIEVMNNELYAPIDTSELSLKNAYEIIGDNNMNEILDETKFGNLLEPFGRIQMMENRRWRAYNDELRQENRTI